MNTDKELYNKVQRMFVLDREFDLGMVFFIRSSTRYFIENNMDASINGLPMEIASEAEENPKAKNLKDYIKNILMMENEDAQGFLLYVVPIVLRINIYIVNIDTSAQARVRYFINFIEQRNSYL